MTEANLSSHPVVELSSDYVIPSSPITPDPFPLGPFDVFVPITIPVAVVFVYRPEGNTLIPPDRLRQALTLVLSSYPQLAGRLVEDQLGNRHITRGSGVLFSTAKCELDLGSGSVYMSDLPGESNDLFVPFFPNPQAVSNGPILSIRHTRFSCGSVALGVRILHTVCDAAGIFQFMQDLAEVYEGMDSGIDRPSRPPTIIPYMSTTQSSVGALKYKPSLFHLEEDPPAAPPPTATLPPASGRFFRYSSSDLASIKATAASDLPLGEFISTFDALCAHLHRCIYIARTKLFHDRPELGILSPPDLLSPVDMRLRPGPKELHDRYLPQALFTTYTSFDPDALLHGPVSDIAQTVHRMVREPTTTSPVETQRTLEWLSAQPDKTKIRNGFRYGSGSLMLSAWNKLDMYDGCTLDVVPVLVSTPFTVVSCVDGLGYFLPSSDRSGAIDVCLALSEPVWAYLDEAGELGGTRLGRPMV